MQGFRYLRTGSQAEHGPTHILEDHEPTLPWWTKTAWRPLAEDMPGLFLFATPKLQCEVCSGWQLRANDIVERIVERLVQVERAVPSAIIERQVLLPQTRNQQWRQRSRACCNPYYTKDVEVQTVQTHGGQQTPKNYEEQVALTRRLEMLEKQVAEAAANVAVADKPAAATFALDHEILQHARDHQAATSKAAANRAAERGRCLEVAAELAWQRREQDLRERRHQLQLQRRGNSKVLSASEIRQKHSYVESRSWSTPSLITQSTRFGWASPG